MQPEAAPEAAREPQWLRWLRGAVAAAEAAEADPEAAPVMWSDVPDPCAYCGARHEDCWDC